MRPELDETHLAPTDPPSGGSTPQASDVTATAAPGGALPSLVGALAAGKQLGHFRIERALGAGGMGEVYLATDLALDRPVAIKVLPAQLARDAKRRDRMIREARAQARVVHPNVGHMYFIGEEGDLLYFAMEYVPGQTLAQRITGGPMSVDDALAAIRDAALGLQEAQKHGFTHRDVKPSNLMIDGHGNVKVLDFGLAAGDLESAMSGGPVAQTSLAGTPLYMAPEQARGDAVDLRTDMYALGATLFHLIAGKPPFESDSVEELLSRHATARRPPLPRRGVPRTRIGAIDSLCTKMMAMRPEDRFASYEDLLRAIELASITHTRPAGFWARSTAMALDCVLISILVAIGTVIVNNASDEIEISIPLIPLLLIYTAVTTWRWGATAGKSLIELEVVDVDTGTRPSFRRALKRSLVMFAVPTVLDLLRIFLAGETTAKAAQITDALFGVMGVLLLFYASLRVTGKRAVWDRLSRTMVRYRTARRGLGRA